MMPRQVAAVASGALVVLAACTERPKELTSSPAPSQSPTPTTSATPTPVASAASSAAAAPFGCRVMGVTGRASTATDAGSVPIGLGATPAARAWVDLEDGTKLQTKDPKTGRELAFDGPGQVQPCRGNASGDEEAWLVRGTFVSSPGSGEAPGQEQWLVTPFGVLRYAAATAKVTVEGIVSVKIPQGAAFLYIAKEARADNAPAAGDDGWRRLGSGTSTNTIVLKPPTGDAKEAARAAVAECRAASDDAVRLARAIAAADGGRLGELPVAHVIARRAARAACAIAGLRAAALAPPEGPRFAALVESADGAWRRLPSASR